METKILIVDGNPLVVKGYEMLLFETQTLHEIVTAHNCNEAYRQISRPDLTYDLAILDALLQPCHLNKLYSGIDVSVLLRKLQPNCKIILLTGNFSDFYYYHIVQRISPDGLIVKGNVNIATLFHALTIVTGDGYFFCNMVQDALRKVVHRNIYIDDMNLEIISLLAKGIRTKNLPQHLNLSISAIDKRKARIKEIFDVEKGSDEDIIREARNKGFI